MPSKPKYELLVFVWPGENGVVVTIASGHKNKEELRGAWRLAAGLLEKKKIAGFIASDTKTGDVLGEKGDTDWTSRT